MKAIIFLVSFLVAAMQAHAAKISDLDVGDVMYLQGIVSDELVMVIRIDARNNRVKVRRKNDMTTLWVHPSRLISREKSTANDFTRGVVFVGALVCALAPHKCKANQAQASVNRRKGTIYYFKAINKCKHKIHLALRYLEGNGKWKAVGWWGVNGNSQRELRYTDGSAAKTPIRQYYYYAYATLPKGSKSPKIYWGGKYNYAVNGKVVPMIYAAGNSDRYHSLIFHCKGY